MGQCNLEIFIVPDNHLILSPQNVGIDHANKAKVYKLHSPQEIICTLLLFATTSNALLNRKPLNLGMIHVSVIPCSVLPL